MKLMIRKYIFLLIALFSSGSYAENVLYLKVKNVKVGSYFILFEDRVESNDRVGLVGQSYFKGKGIFIVDNGFINSSRVFRVLVKDQRSGVVEVSQDLVFSDGLDVCADAVFYHWIIECGVREK